MTKPAAVVIALVMRAETATLIVRTAAVTKLVLPTQPAILPAKAETAIRPARQVLAVTSPARAADVSKRVPVQPAVNLAAVIAAAPRTPVST